MMMREHDKYADRLAILPAVLRKYIPSQLLRKVDKKEIYMTSDYDYISQVLDNSNNQLRMYGSAEELLNNIHLYSNFPLSRKVFPIRMGSYYYTIPDAYHNLKGELLYCKQDYLFHLQSSVYRDLGQGIAPELVEYMKKHAERLGGCYEFVKYDHEIFETIQKFFIFSQCLQEFPADAQFTVSVSPMTIEAYEEWDFIKVFEDLILEYPWIFLPNSETNDKKAIHAVRIFDDKYLRYVMESELYNAINTKHPDREPLECKDTDGMLRTIDMKDALKIFRDDIAGIDFIPYPIGLTWHAAVPIATPSGDHCILAGDALTEILSRSIHALQIFQKIKRNMVPKFIKLLEKYFPPDIDCRCFMSLTTIQKLREEHDEFWKRFDEKPAKQVRDVGPNGFTAEDLKKELKYLGYTDLFTEITTTTVKQAYMSVFSTRKTSDLTTTDMTRLIENILIEVLIARFPSLQEFISRQKYCLHCRESPCGICTERFNEADRKIEKEKKTNPVPVIHKTVPEVPEAKPKIQSNPEVSPLIENQNCLQYTLDDVKMFYNNDYDFERSTLGWSMELPNGKIIVTNHKFVNEQDLRKKDIDYFLIDDDDVEWARAKSPRLANTNPYNTDEFGQVLKSLDNFVKDRPNKRIYIRTVPFNTAGGVFTDDILTIIPIVLKQQNTEIENYKEKLDEYRNKWKCTASYLHRVIDTEEFVPILKEFGVDLSLITIVPDLVYSITTDGSDINRSIYPWTFTPTGHQVLHNFTAVQAIFQSLVCGINWSLEACQTHPNCKQEFRDYVAVAMLEYAKMEKGSFISSLKFSIIVHGLEQFCTFKCQKRLKQTKFENRDCYESELPVAFYRNAIKSYNLSDRLEKYTKRREKIPVWMYRAAYVSGWCEAFFQRPELSEIKKFILESSVFRFSSDILKKNSKCLEDIIGIPLENAATRSTSPLNWSQKVYVKNLGKTLAEWRRTHVPISDSFEMKPTLVPVVDSSKDPCNKMRRTDSSSLKIKVSDGRGEVNTIPNAKLVAEPKPAPTEDLAPEAQNTGSSEIRSDPTLIPIPDPSSAEVKVPATKSDSSLVPTTDLSSKAPILPSMDPPLPSDLLCQKCNESREEVIETYRKVMNLEKSLKEKDAELEKLRELEVKAKRSDEMERKSKEMEKESEELKKKHLKILEENHKMMKGHGNSKQLEDRLKEKELALKASEYSIDSMETEIQDVKSERSRWFQAAIDKDKMIKQLEEKLGKALKDDEKSVRRAEQAERTLNVIGDQYENSYTVNNRKIAELKAAHTKSMEEKDKEIEQLKRDHSKLLDEKSGEMEQLKQAHSKLLAEKTKEWTVEKKNHSKTIEELKKSHSEVIKLKASKCQEVLKTKISEKDSEVLHAKRINKELTESIRVLGQKVSDLEEKSDADHLEMAMKQSHLENELKEKERVILNLQESRTQQAAEQDKAKKELKDKLSAMRSIMDSIDPAPQSPQAQRTLLGLQKIRDKLQANSPLKLAQDMVERLISLSTRPEIHQMARYEYEQYEGKVCVYVQELEVSIDKLNDKSSMTTPPLPSQFPSFSDRFMNEYWMEIDKSRNEVVDNECLICLSEIALEQNTLECTQCKKVVHRECGLQWLRVARTCAHCRMEQLDPNEFPALQ